MSQVNMQEATMKETVGNRQVDSEVVVKGERRQFSQSYKQRIVEEAGRCPNGEVGALLRREGLYGSHLSKWRHELKVKKAGSGGRGQGGLAPARTAEALSERLWVVEEENTRLRSQLVQANAIMAAQKKLVQSFERCLTPSKFKPS